MQPDDDRTPPYFAALRIVSLYAWQGPERDLGHVSLYSQGDTELFCVLGWTDPGENRPLRCPPEYRHPNLSAEAARAVLERYVDASARPLIQLDCPC